MQTRYFTFATDASIGRFVMFEIDALWAGLLGGFIGGITIIGVMYFNYQSILHEYIFAKEVFKTRRMTIKMQQEIAELQKQVADLNMVIYDKVTEDEYR